MRRRTRQLNHEDLQITISPKNGVKTGKKNWQKKKEVSTNRRIPQLL